MDFAKPQQQQQQPSGFSVYIGNIPYNATENDIGTYFSQAGTVTNVSPGGTIGTTSQELVNTSRLIYDKVTNRPKGFGFCEFADQQGAERAITNLNGADFNGRALRVNWANKYS